MANEKDKPKMTQQGLINDLKVKLYDVIEQQAVLQAEHNRLEQLKSDLAKRLGAARTQLQKDEAEAKARYEEPEEPVGT